MEERFPVCGFDILRSDVLEFGIGASIFENPASEKSATGRTGVSQ
jgi:hypothetical protein